MKYFLKKSPKSLFFRRLFVLKNSVFKEVYPGLLFIALLIIAGCRADPSFSPNHEPPTCEFSSDCPEDGQLCSLNGYCFHAATPSMNLAIEVIPNSTSKEGSTFQRTRTEFAPQDMEYIEDGTVKLVYRRPAHIAGQVSVIDYAIDGSGFDIFDAQVSVWRTSRIPGRPKVLYNTSVSLDMTVGEREGEKNTSFDLHIPKNDSYTMRVTPQEFFATVFPPLVIRDIPVNEDADPTFLFDLEGEYLTATGRVVDPMGNGVSGIQAHMKDEAGIYSSTVSNTTDESGEFMLAIPLGKRDYVLELYPVEEPSFRPKIQFYLEDVGAESAGLSIELSAEGDKNFEYPALLTPCEYVYKVMGISDAGVREPVSGAVVNFFTHVGGGTNDDGMVSMRATSDETGQIRVNLIPGLNQNTRDYDVNIISPLDSRYASKITNVTVSRCGGTGADLELDLRTEVVGSVVDSSGNPLSNITINARASTTESNNGTAASLMTNLGIRPTQTTGENGKFFIKLDPGFYDFEFVPASKNYMPRWLFSDIEIKQDISKTLNIEFPDARLLMGRLVDEEGAPVTGFDVKVYMVSTSCIESDVCETPAFYLGEGEALNDGRFEVIIPEVQ